MAQQRGREFVARVNDWFDRHARPFPWRSDDCSPWGVLVSEVMSQQTQMARVLPRWEAFMARWPSPAALADATDAEVIRAWDRLGYPRRAVALRRCAQQIVAQHGGEVPADRDALLALPGIGAYTSAAVTAFAFGIRVPVVDTNVRRVLARSQHGEELAWAPNSRRDEAEMLALLPEDPAEAATWNAAAMELGALVCTAKRPACDDCPAAELCEWNLAGQPRSIAPQRRQPKFAGSDRQLRGAIMALLREHGAGVALQALPERVAQRLPATAPDTEFSARVLRLADALIRDGLATRSGGRLRLPQD